MIVGFGKTSTARLNTCCKPLRETLKAAAADPACPCDFGVVCGYRGEVKQTNAFTGGKSNARWGESDHNVRRGDQPWSHGADVAPYDPAIRDYVWDDDLLYAALVSHILTHASRLGYHLESGMNYKLRGGKNDPGHLSVKHK